MEQPLVSIALCTYNGGAYLAAQLDTLINQSYQNIEIVAVDDCSSDDTFAILKDYATRYQQFRVHQNETNLGFTSNFEKAVQLCTGELIALCDQDDLWHPDKITLQVEAIKDNIFIYHDSEFIHADGSTMNKKMSDVVNFYRGDRPETFLFFNCVSGHAILMKRELLQDVLPLKKEFFHDWWMAYAATNIGTIDFIPKCLVQYRQHEKSDTNILRLERKKNSYKFNSIQKVEREHKWLAYCASFKKNKEPELISQFYEAYTKRMNGFISFALSRLLYRYRDTVFFIQKKSKASKLNYIYNRIWGVGAKKLLMKK